MEIIDNNIVTLNEYIKMGKAKSFLKLMKTVDKALIEEHEKGLAIVNINLDQISIDIASGKIIFPTINKFDPLDKTIAGYKTGVSINTDRKSSFEHNENSLALMILGWYVNPDHSSIESDMVAVEHYQEFQNKIPRWINKYFIDRFKRMSDIKFCEYYDENFVNRINEDMDYLQLTKEDRKKMNQNIITSVNFNIKRLLFSARITRDDLFNFYEQFAIDNYEKNFGTREKEDNMTTGGKESNLTKTLYKPGTEREYMDDPINYHVENLNQNNKQTAYATVLALALIGCLSLLVSVVSFIIFSKLF